MRELTFTDKDGNALSIEPNTDWVNYGDINPKQHGGTWVSWENDMWHIIQTRHPNTLPKDMVDNEQMIEHTWLEPQDLFQSGDPNDGPTNKFRDEIKSLSNVTGYVNALVGFDIEYFVAGVAHRIHSRETDYVDNSNYWDYLKGYGIEL